jgi:misacylated tRNA(Ala) deacylase
MTDVLYLKPWDPASGSESPNYIREFDATVTKVTPDGWVLLDRTAFYAEGGGQPSDRGWLKWDGGECEISDVSKKGVLKHKVKGTPPPEGAAVHGVIDWELRHRHMRMHTSQHTLSGVVWKMFKAKTAGNQIHATHSRVDFAPAKWSDDDVKRIEDECNRIFASGMPVRISERSRTDLESALAGRSIIEAVPSSVKMLRVVEVGDYDSCPCGGTHVANTNEIGRMNIVAREYKGKETERVVYELAP